MVRRELFRNRLSNATWIVGFGLSIGLLLTLLMLASNDDPRKSHLPTAVPMTADPLLDTSDAPILVGRKPAALTPLPFVASPEPAVGLPGILRTSDGDPVAGAYLVIAKHAKAGEPSGAASTAVSDVHGEFSFASMTDVPSGAWLFVSAAGRQAHAVDASALPREDAKLLVVLPDGGAIQGVVVDSANNPIPGAVVQARGQGWEDLVWRDDQRPRTWDPRTVPLFTATTTGSRGEFALLGLSPVTYQLVAGRLRWGRRGTSCRGWFGRHRSRSRSGEMGRAVGHRRSGRIGDTDGAVSSHDGAWATVESAGRLSWHS